MSRRVKDAPSWWIEPSTDVYEIAKSAGKDYNIAINNPSPQSEYDFRRGYEQGAMHERIRAALGEEK